MRLINRIASPRRTLWQLQNYLRLRGDVYSSVCRSLADEEALQRKWEWLAFLSAAQSLKPRRVLEIGTYRGGNLRLLAKVCPPSMHYISLDLPSGGFGGGYSKEDVVGFRKRMQPSQRIDCLRMDSHSSQAHQAVSDLLGDTQIDLLFIDGDHSRTGVADDFFDYGPLVREGGLIAFHDIVPHAVHKSCQVHLFWDDLKKVTKVRELVDRDGFDRWGGIGLLTVPRGGTEPLARRIRADPAYGRNTPSK